MSWEKKAVFANGEVVYKTEEGVYFHAFYEGGIPFSIDKEEGEKLFEKADSRIYGLSPKFAIIEETNEGTE